MVAHFVDVGQGDATLLEFACGAILIDTGGEDTDDVVGRDRLTAYLEDFFNRRSDLAWQLDLVVLSHPHKDHTDGVTSLLSHEPAFIIANVLDNGDDTPKPEGFDGQRTLQDHAAANQSGYVGLEHSTIKTVAGVTGNVIDPLDCRNQNGGGVDPKVTALWGRVDAGGWATNENNDSVVVRVDFGESSFLFTGDLQSQGIKAMLDSYGDDLSMFDVDVIKVGHHGSHNATTADFVDALSPRVAVIQCGDSTLSRAQHSAYSYAHPHRDAINLLLGQGGVSMTRDPITARVGVKGRNPTTKAAPQFANRVIRKAIYANGWDGNIAVKANSSGVLTVETNF